MTETYCTAFAAAFVEAYEATGDAHEARAWAEHVASAAVRRAEAEAALSAALLARLNLPAAPLTELEARDAEVLRAAGL